MTSQNKALYSLLIGIAIVLGIAIGQLLNFNQKSELSFHPTEKDKIDNLLRYIKEDYVDYVSTDSIVDTVIKDILKNLDPHSVYIPQEEVSQADEELDGEFTGIGVVFQKYKDTFTIIRPLEKGPAKAAGLKTMDRILQIEDDVLFGKNIDIYKISKKIKGKAETKIKLKVYRKTKDSIFDVEITRKHIPLVSVPAHFMINDTLGLIKISSFALDTYDEFKTALKSLKQKGMTALILDLRDNTGGLLKQADLIADEFLKNGKLIFFTKNNSGEIKKNMATARGDFEKGNIYVLINENTASASEIIAGALQDNDKATIIGRRSFGKGLVQREMYLGDGSKIRLTTARYYTPTGRSIQKPYKKGHFDEYRHDFQKRQYNGELFYKDSIHVNDSLRYTTPKGKVVYGGGGIVPDIFVPIDKNAYIYNLNFLNRFISDFVTNYLDMNTDKLLSISPEDYINSDIEEELYEKFIRSHKKSMNNKKRHKNSQAKENLKILLKALLARDLFDSNVYYQILMKNDAALKIILQDKTNVPTG